MKDSKVSKFGGFFFWLTLAVFLVPLAGVAFGDFFVVGLGILGCLISFYYWFFQERSALYEQG